MSLKASGSPPSRWQGAFLPHHHEGWQLLCVHPSRMKLLERCFGWAKGSLAPIKKGSLAPIFKFTGNIGWKHGDFYPPHAGQDLGTGRGDMGRLHPPTTCREGLGDREGTWGRYIHQRPAGTWLGQWGHGTLATWGGDASTKDIQGRTWGHGGVASTNDKQGIT